MKRLIAIIVFVPIAILLVAFSVANRANVTISLDPFNAAEPAVSVALPLFVLLFCTLALGVLIGGVAAWLGQSRWRREARRLRREARKTGRENTALRSASAPSPATAIPGSTLPAIRRDAA